MSLRGPATRVTPPAARHAPRAAAPGGVRGSTEAHPTVVRDAAPFEWIERVQTHDDGNFNYLIALHEFVDGGMRDSSFINVVSKIVAGGSSDAKGTIQ